MSYAYLRNNSADELNWFLNHPHIEVLVDCGAFTALNVGKPISLDNYIEFLDKWKNNLCGYIALDVLGDPKATRENLRVMTEAGLKPIPVHVRGDDANRMDELFEISDWVALGGLRRPHRGLCDPSYVKYKMDMAAGRRVHWLGYTRQQQIVLHKPYSVDCASWASGTMFGNISLYLGDGRWLKGVKRGDKRPAVEKWLIERGVSPQDFNNKFLWGSRLTSGVGHLRHIPHRIQTCSWVEYSLDLMNAVGTKLFLAMDVSSISMQILYRLNELFGHYPIPERFDRADCRAVTS